MCLSEMLVSPGTGDRDSSQLMEALGALSPLVLQTEPLLPPPLPPMGSDGVPACALTQGLLDCFPPPLLCSP